MIRSLSASALLLLTAAPCHPQNAGNPSHAAVRSPTYAAIEDVGWFYEPNGRDRSVMHLRIAREGHTVTFDASETAAIVGEGAAASLASPGEAVSFTLARPAGALACSGRSEPGYRASGICRFTPDGRFVADLAQRGLAAEDAEELMALALVDARLESIDDLSRAGFQIDDVEDVIALAALEVTANFAGELRAAGLTVSKTEDLIAAKAVQVDPAWLGAMAEAGYPDLSVDQAIELRALEVTPEYARKMSRVRMAVEDAR